MMCFCIASQSCSSLTVMWCTSAVWRTGIFSLWQHRQRFTPDLSWTGSADRGLVAARSGRTCHLASSLPDKTLCACSTGSPYEELSRPRHLNMARGSVNVYSVTASPLCSVGASATAPEVMHERQTLMFRDQEINAQIQHLSISTHFHTPATIIASPEYRWKRVYFPKKASGERDAT